MNSLSSSDCPTPYLAIDAGRLRANVARMQDYVTNRGLGLRPHTKTHKSLRLAQMQLDAGAIGLTVAKVGEARVMADSGGDLLLAYPAVDEARCDNVAILARERSVTVAIDSIEAAQGLHEAATRSGSRIGILVDLDVGMGRTGVQSPADALALARQIDGLAGLRMRGLMCYPGHIWEAINEQAGALAQVAALLDETVELLRGGGLDTSIVSGGSTPTAYQSHLVRALTEIRPGTYIFNDMNTVHGGFCKLEECAASVVCTVVSDAVPGQVVLDAGSKTLTNDRCIPAPDRGFGYIVEYPEAIVTKLSEEHGQVDIRSCASAPRIGERVSVIPNHICPCVNLQDEVWWREGDRLEPLTVDARGKLS